MFDWLIALLIWLSADPAAVDRYAPRAAAAADVAYSSMVRAQAAQPARETGGKPLPECPDGKCPLVR